jgi:hypothetical protein
VLNESSQRGFYFYLISVIKMSFRHTTEKSPLSTDDARSIRCIREMAFALVLTQTGTELDDGVLDGLCGNVASIAEEFNLSPERVQEILVAHEPTLGVGEP